MADIEGPETFADFKKQQTETEVRKERKLGSVNIGGGGDLKSPNDISGALSEISKELSSRDKKKITLEINAKMLAVFELVGLYSDVNQEIIEKRLHQISPQFESVTQEL